MTADQWLIRTARNVIVGPYPRDKIRELILEGKLEVEDEVCPANGYWFSLHESEEVLRQLGIRPPISQSENDVTKTGMQPGGRESSFPEMPELVDVGEGNDEISRAAIFRRGFKSFGGRKSDSGEASSPGATAAGGFGTTMASGAADRYTLPTPEEGSSGAPKIQIFPVIERPRYLQAFIWLLLVGAVIAAVAVVRLVTRTI